MENFFNFSDKFGYNSPWQEDWSVRAQDNTNKINNTNDNRKEVNMMIVLDKDNMAQFNDLKVNIWTVRHIDDLSDYEKVQTLVNEFIFKDLIIVHHGNVYSTVARPRDKRIILDSKYLEQIRHTISLYCLDVLEIAEEWPNKEYNNELFEEIQHYSTNRYIGGLPLNHIKAYFSLRLLLNNIINKGNYISIACDEGDNVSTDINKQYLETDVLKELGSLVENEITLYVNTNKSMIKYGQNFEDNNKIEFTYGCILNNYITPHKYNNTFDSRGWICYNTLKRAPVITHSDLWISSINQKKIILLARKNILEYKQVEKAKWTQAYFSKQVEKYYIKKWGNEHYQSYLRTIEASYPEIKIK